MQTWVTRRKATNAGLSNYSWTDTGRTIDARGVKMAAISIRDLGANGVLSFDLIDLLRLAGPAVAASSWLCSGVEATGPRADEIHAAADCGVVLGGDELLRIASGISQVIDGDFRAMTGPGAQPWLRIRAIDSSEFVVIGTDEAVLARISAAYRDVHPSPEDDL